MKPPYSVPSMAEIAALEWNGLKVVSTFSGGGGSCTGYRMAGYRVVWANEFIEEAQRTYKANHPDSILDPRDIRTITAAEILAATGLEVGELDVLDGSPPCASFSTAGKREAGWGKVKKYSDKAQRTDDLFLEYARLLDGLKPRAFIAENVSGLVKGTAKGYFLEILGALKACGYRVKAAVLNAAWLGVPQSRERLIFIGIRQDLKRDPVHPRPFRFQYTVADALPWIRSIEGGNGYDGHAFYSAKQPAATIQATRTLKVEAEADISKYAIGREWERLGKPGTVSKKYFQLKRPALDKPCLTITGNGGDGSIASVCHPTEKRKFSIAELRRICAFPEDYILTGSYKQQWERMGRSVPPLMMREIAASVAEVLHAAN